MKISAKLAITLFGSLMAVSSHAADGVKFALKLESGGKLLGTPVLMTQFGARASIQTGGESTGYRIEMLAQDAGATADIALKLFLDEGEGMKLVSEPRIVAPFGSPSSMAYTAKDGSTVRLTIQASRAEMPKANQ